MCQHLSTGKYREALFGSSSTSGLAPWSFFLFTLAAVLTLGALGTILYFWLPKDAPFWQRLFDRTLITPDEALATRAHERVWEGRLQGPGGAVEAFEAALRRDPASPYRWCELGETLLEAGRTEEARRCFRRGVELGAGTPSILMRAANFHFRLGENRQALTFTIRVLAMTPEFDQVIFSSYARLGVSIEEALADGVPKQRRAAQAFLRHLLADASAGPAETVWRWARALAFVDDALADEYAGFLLAQRQYDKALAAWAGHFSARHPGFPQPNRIFNGGFEHEPAGSTFDWRIEPVEGVEVERDNATSAEGHWSLRLRFAGQENLAYRHVSQRAVVHPGPWRFQAQVRTEDLTTDQGLAFQIVDAEAPARLDLKTEPLLGTREWSRIEAPLVIPPPTRLVEIRLVRQPSLKFDSKIRGAAWIDDVRLVAASAR